MSNTTTPVPPAVERTYRTRTQKVPAFARFEGTSAWKKYKRRARAYARFKAGGTAANAQPAAEAGPEAAHTA